MRGALAGALMAGLVAGCAVTDAVVTPALDQRTGTTLAERCAGYRADVAAYDAIRTGRELSDFEAAAYGAAQLFLAARCTPTTPPAIVGHWVPEFALVEASPREVLAQACLADWCPLVRPAIAAELGCPPPADPPARGYLHDYALEAAAGLKPADPFPASRRTRREAVPWEAQPPPAGPPRPSSSFAPPWRERAALGSAGRGL